MSTKTHVEELISMVEKADFLGAIEKFYADDASMQENNETPRAGLATLLEHERKVMQNFKTIHRIQAASYVVDGDRAVINWIFEVTDAGGHRRYRDELAYQLWHNGRIARERFYYDTARPQEAAA